MFRYLVITCLGICLAGSAFSQAIHDVTGNWYGFFRTPQGNRQRLQLSFDRTGGSLKGTMKSPDATEDAIAIDSIYATDDSLKFIIKKISLVYTGGWNTRNGRYEGYFEQLGNRAELNFSRREIKEGELPVERPQEPQPPFAYDVEEVKFVNKKDKVLLSGSFSKPGIKGTFPAIVIISGEGRQDRDGEHFGHKPFAVITDYLVKHGMAVLRFDDRGTGSSTGNYDSSNIYNFAEDVRAAVSFLRLRKDVDSNAIGLLGDGLGGAEGEIVAADDHKIAFLILMAAAGMHGQSAYLAKAVQFFPTGKPAAVSSFKDYLHVMATEKDTVIRKKKAYAALTSLFRQTIDTSKELPLELMNEAYQADNHPEVISALQYDPAVYLSKINCPVLAMNGDKDIEVNAAQNLKGIESGLVKGGNQTVTLRTFPGLNHLFQRCNSCTIQEYGSLDETINPAVLELMTRWIQLLY
jgi:pimeloyl-ACP methyl ester carboxylesterase